MEDNKKFYARKWRFSYINGERARYSQKMENAKLFFYSLLMEIYQSE